MITQDKLAEIVDQIPALDKRGTFTGPTWEDAIKSEEKLGPDKLDWKMSLPVQPVAMPGRTKLT